MVPKIAGVQIYGSRIQIEGQQVGWDLWESKVAAAVLTLGHTRPGGWGG